MMRKLSMILLAGLVAACVRTQRNPATGDVDLDVESPTKSGETWNARLTGQAGYPSVSGSARASVANNQTTTTISLTGATAGGTHPWHVHEGKCGSGGAIVGDASAYSPLSVGTQGTAQGSATLSVVLNEAKDYHVNVHASPTDLPTIVACGNLDD